MEPRYTRSTTKATPSGHPPTINPAQTPQSPHIITSDEKSLSYKPLLPTSIYINGIPQPPNKVIPTESSNETLNKNSVEPLSIITLNLVHKDATNLPPLPHSLPPSPCKNRTQFEPLNLHRIFGCRQYRNKNQLTVATNSSLFN